VVSLREDADGGESERHDGYDEVLPEHSVEDVMLDQKSSSRAVRDSRVRPSARDQDLSRTVGDKLHDRQRNRVRAAQGEVLAVVGPSGAGQIIFHAAHNADEPNRPAQFWLTRGRLPFRSRRANSAPHGMDVMQMAYLFPGTVAANIDRVLRQRHQTFRG